MATLILERAPIGDNEDDYDVIEGGTVIGRIFKVPAAPEGRPWMWASGHNGERPTAVSPRARRRWRRSRRAGGGVAGGKQ